MKKMILMGASVCVLLTACSPFNPIDRDVHRYLEDFNPLVHSQNAYTKELKRGFMDVTDHEQSEKALAVLQSELGILVKGAEAIHPKTKEVQGVHAHYVNGLHLQQKGLKAYQDAFDAATDQLEEALIVKGDDYMEKADHEFAAHEQAMKQLAKEKDVKIDFK